MVQLLISAGADVTVKDKVFTSIHLYALFLFFVECDFDDVLFSKKGCTALHYAAQKEGFAMVKILLMHGAAVDARNEVISYKLLLYYSNDSQVICTVETGNTTATCCSQQSKR
jgi:ankyrin repeat protein